MAARPCRRKWRCEVEKAFGVSMDTLLRMQAWYDGYVMRQRQREINVKRFTPKTASIEVRRVG